MRNTKSRSLWIGAALLAAGVISAQAQVAPWWSEVSNDKAPGYTKYDAATDTYTLQGCGSDVWATADHFQFAYVSQNTGEDFDYMVRMESFGGDEVSSWMKAGLMVREGYYGDENLEWSNWDETAGYDITQPSGYMQLANSRCVAIMGFRADATAAGASKWATHWRTAEGENITDSLRSLSAENYVYPSWLRIRSKAGVFRTYTSGDGEDWILQTTLDTTTWANGALGNTTFGTEKGYGLHIGMFATSHDEGDAGGSALAVFSQFKETVQNPITFVTTPDANITVDEGKSLGITAKVSGYDPFTYVLKKGDQEISSGEFYETQFTYSFGEVLVSATGDYTLSISNQANGETHTVETAFSVNVNPIEVGPEVIFSGYNPVTEVVYARFNRVMDAASLANTSNYTVKDADGNAVVVSQATPSADARYVSLTIPSLVLGGTYTLAVSGVTDESGTAISATEPKAFSVTVTTGVKAQVYVQDGTYSRFPNHLAFRDAIWNGTAGDANGGAIDIPALDYNTNVSGFDYFCAFVEGYIIAPETGSYRFAVASDDQAMVYLSTDSSKENIQLLCESPDYSGVRIYSVHATQQSGLVDLVSGELYYFQIFFFEEAGGEVFSLAWSLPSEGPLDKVADGTVGIGGEYITAVYNPANTVLEVVSEPATTVSVAPNGSFTLPVEIKYSSELNLAPTYQWYVKKDGGDWTTADGLTDVTGATTTTLSFKNALDANHNGIYRLDAALAGKAISTSEITVIISSEDVVPPTAIVTGHNEMNKVVINLSEPVYGHDSVESYSIEGLEITGVLTDTTGVDMTKAVLMTSTQEPGKVYTVNFSGIYDMMGNEMKSSAQFTAFVWSPGYALLECFGTQSTFEGLFETTSWNSGSHPYMLAPQIARYLEITTTTFNQDNCVERISGYIIPEEDGTYEFAGSVDDDFKFWISTDENPANLTDNPVAWEQGWNTTGMRVYDWSGIAADATYGFTPIDLKAGQKYFYVASLREGGGGDFLGLSWRNTKNAWQANGTAPILTGKLIGIYANPDTASITVTEQPEACTAKAGDDVTLSVVATTKNDWNAPISYQWFVGETLIEGATTASATFQVLPAYNGQEAYCEMTVPGRTVQSAGAQITVAEDVEAITPVTAMGMGRTIYVLFDKQPEAESACDIANYTVSNATVSAALLTTFKDSFAVALTIGEFNSSTVNVKVSGVKNLSGVPMVAPVTLIGGYSPLTPIALGNPSPAGTMSVYPGSIEATAGGDDFWGGADSGLYMYEIVNGDFDAVIHSESLENLNTYTKLGLQFRATLDANSPVVAILTCPQESTWDTLQASYRPYPAGSSCLETWPRLNEDGSALTETASMNQGCVIYPQNWLRLKRTGNNFFAYRSYDGKRWDLVNQGNFVAVGDNTSAAMPPQGYIGIGLTSHYNGFATKAVISTYTSSYIDDGGALPTPDESNLTAATIGSEGAPAGYYDYDASTGIYSIAGCGPDVWGVTDNCYYLNQLAPEGDFVITAQVLDFVAPSANWAKAGLMIREADAEGNFYGGSRYVLTHTQRMKNPGNKNYRGAWRPVVDMQVTDAESVTGSAIVWPHWQRLSRVGNVITGYTSADGVTWEQYMEVDTASEIWTDGPLGSTLPLYVGLWVTSNSAVSNAAYAQFSNVTIEQGGPAPTDLVLSYSVEGAELTLTWESGTLQSSTDCVTWQNVLGAESGVKIPTTEGATYFRLVK